MQRVVSNGEGVQIVIPPLRSAVSECNVSGRLDDPTPREQVRRLAEHLEGEETDHDRTKAELARVRVQLQQTIAEVNDCRARYQASLQITADLQARIERMQELVNVSFRVERLLEQRLGRASENRPERWAIVVNGLMRKQAWFFNQRLPVAGFWLVRLIRFWGWGENTVAELSGALDAYAKPIVDREQLCYIAASLALVGGLCAAAEAYSLAEAIIAGPSTRRLRFGALRTRVEVQFLDAMRALARQPAEELTSKAIRALLLRNVELHGEHAEPVSVDELWALLVGVNSELRRSLLPYTLAQQCMQNIMQRLDSAVLRHMIERHHRYSVEFATHLLQGVTRLHELWQALWPSGAVRTLLCEPLIQLKQAASLLMLDNLQVVPELRERLCPALSMDHVRRLVLNERAESDTKTFQYLDKQLTPDAASPRPGSFIDGPQQQQQQQRVFDVEQAFAWLSYDEFQTIAPRDEWVEWFSPPEKPPKSLLQM